MSASEEGPSQFAGSLCAFRRRNLFRSSKLLNARIELAKIFVGARRYAAGPVLASLLAGCVTTASAPSVPSSPFLTAVVRLDPFPTRSNAGPSTENSSQSTMSANAAVIGEGAKNPPAPPAAASAPSQGKPVGQGGSVNSVNTIPLDPLADRRGVYPSIAYASPGMAGTLAAARQPSANSDKGSPSLAGTAAGRGISLSDAVGAAVMSHPLMGAQAAKVTGSLADVRTAQGATKPQLQVYAGSGGSYLGGYSNYPRTFGSVDVPGSSRSDAGFTLRQLVFDFGAAKADIARSKSVVDAERLRLADQAEDIALRTVNAYFNLLEQEQLIAEINKVVADDNNFSNLVKLNERQGNGTAADVNRIRSKVIEVEALRTDIETAYRTSQDEFARLTKLDSGKIRNPKPVPAKVPATYEAAYQGAQQSNPSLLALKATGVSFDNQLASQKAQRLPRVDIQGDGLVKHYVGGANASPGIVDSRLMLMVSYKLLDGGTMAAQADRIREDRTANDFRTIDERESIELNLRRLYQALSANRIKENAAVEGMATARKANSLYLEQFKAGKRTVFEVLDSRMVVFTMQKNSISAHFEQLRASYGILRNMGRLVETAIRV
jgi:adhesin transport system outer membrane protein